MKLVVAGIATVLCSLAAAPFVLGEIAVVIYDGRESFETKKIVFGVDLATGKEVWRKEMKKAVNFAVRVKDGTLVGSDDGFLTLLEAATGRENWSVRMPGPIRHVNTFKGEYDSGYLVADQDEILWFVSRSGEILWSKR